MGGGLPISATPTEWPASLDSLGYRPHFQSCPGSWREVTSRGSGESRDLSAAVGRFLQTQVKEKGKKRETLPARVSSHCMLTPASAPSRPPFGSRSQPTARTLGLPHPQVPIFPGPPLAHPPTAPVGNSQPSPGPGGPAARCRGRATSPWALGREAGDTGEGAGLGCCRPVDPRCPLPSGGGRGWWGSGLATSVGAPPAQRPPVAAGGVGVQVVGVQVRRCRGARTQVRAMSSFLLNAGGRGRQQDRPGKAPGCGGLGHGVGGLQPGRLTRGAVLQPGSFPPDAARRASPEPLAAGTSSVQVRASRAHRAAPSAAARKTWRSGLQGRPVWCQGSSPLRRPLLRRSGLCRAPPTLRPDPGAACRLGWSRTAVGARPPGRGGRGQRTLGRSGGASLPSARSGLGAVRDRGRGALGAPALGTELAWRGPARRG